MHNIFLILAVLALSSIIGFVLARRSTSSYGNSRLLVGIFFTPTVFISTHPMAIVFSAGGFLATGYLAGLLFKDDDDSSI